MILCPIRWGICPKFIRVGIGEGLGRGNKICLDRFLNGDLDEDVYETMAEFFPDAKVLTQPSINYIEVWDGTFTGGDIVRKSEIHDKILNMRVLKSLGWEWNAVDTAVNMDVELDDETCLLVESDASGRQLLSPMSRPVSG